MGWLSSFWSDTVDFVTEDANPFSDEFILWGDDDPPASANSNVPEATSEEDALLQSLTQALNEKMSQDPWDVYPTDPGMTAEQLAELQAVVESGGQLPDEFRQLLDPQTLSAYDQYLSGGDNAVTDFMRQQAAAHPGELIGTTDPETGQQINVTVDPETGYFINAETGNIFTPAGGPDSPFSDEYFTETGEQISDFNNPWVQSQMEQLELNRQMMQGLVDQLPIEAEQGQLFNEILQKQIDDLSSPAAMARRQAEENYWNEVAQEAEQGIDFGSITGDLTPEEEQALTQKKQNAYEMMETTINRSVMDSMGSEISRLVGRGVIDSSVAENAFDLMARNITDASKAGALGIENEYINTWLGVRGQNYANRLAAEQTRAGFMTQGGIVTGQQTGSDYSSILNSLNTQNQTGNILDFVQGGNQYYAGLGQQADQYWNSSGADMFGTLYGGRLTAGQMALQQSIANMQSSAAEDASMWGALGSGAGIAAGLIFSSKRFKENIKRIRSSTLKNGKSIDFVAFNYIWDKTKQIGVLAEELIKVLPGAVVSVDGEPTYVDYRILNRELEGVHNA